MDYHAAVRQKLTKYENISNDEAINGHKRNHFIYPHHQPMRPI